MAEKFGNFRWVKEGWLDNRSPGFVVGELTLAGIGRVDICLRGDCKGEIRNGIFEFRNSQFYDDAHALDRLADFENPQCGNVSLISFDPHPLLEPHPYIEWFSHRGRHYRIELAPEEAWIVPPEESHRFDDRSERIRKTYSSHGALAERSDSEQEWF